MIRTLFGTKPDVETKPEHNANAQPDQICFLAGSHDPVILTDYLTLRTTKGVNLDHLASVVHLSKNWWIPNAADLFKAVMSAQDGVQDLNTIFCEDMIDRILKRPRAMPFDEWHTELFRRLGLVNQLTKHPDLLACLNFDSGPADLRLTMVPQLRVFGDKVVNGAMYQDPNCIKDNLALISDIPEEFKLEVANALFTM
jgi:hypothetical protein